MANVNDKDGSKMPSNDLKGRDKRERKELKHSDDKDGKAGEGDNREMAEEEPMENEYD